jgi:hypothetical protein
MDAQGKVQYKLHIKDMGTSKLTVHSRLVHDNNQIGTGLE